MKELIDQILTGITELKARANQVLKEMPPLEQIEGANEVTWALRSMKSAAEYLKESTTTLESKMTELQAKLPTHVEQEVNTAIEQKKTAQELLSKTDAQAAADAAANAREKEVRQQIATVAQRRVEISSGDKPMVSAAVAARIDDTVLIAEDYKGNVQKIADRLANVSKLTDRETVLAEIAAMPLTEQGDREFTSRMELIREIAGAGVGSRQSTPGTQVPAPFKAGSGTEAEADANCF